MKVLVALSGGVDSAVAALLLKEQGHDVAAAYMKNWINEENILGDCPWQQDIVDARAVSGKLGIGFEVLNFIKDYRERVVKYLVDGYARGITPNPDVMCNREMKFGVLLDWALENGFDAVATGHYARKAHGGSMKSPVLGMNHMLEPESGGEDSRPDTLNLNPESPALLEGVDKNKDQSYFLAMITPEQLARAEFPVGGLTKPELRAMANKAGLPNADKKDSQGICFIGQVKINDFLEHYIPDSPGEIVNTAGEVLGEHRGLHRYTLGQRRGIGIPSNADNEFYVVVGKQAQGNRLVVAFEKPGLPGLYGREFRLHGLNWLAPALTADTEILAKARYRDPSAPAVFYPEIGGEPARVVFHAEQRGLASGQICALYDGERLLGGGIYL